MKRSNTLHWRKSSFSGNNGNCVEVAKDGGRFAVRDSKDPNGPRLSLTTQDLRSLIEGVKSDTI